ncbi:MAG: DUF3352 domain-containing protein, partial [Solirubrobacteraceae bacterium]
MSEVRAPSRLHLALSALALLALLVSGCGSSSSTVSAVDPASGVPASAPLYIGAVIQPSGSLKSNAVTVAHQLTHMEHPYEALLSAIQSEGPTHITWSQLKPWVGQRAGLFIQSLKASGSALSLLEKGISGGTLSPSAAKAAAESGQSQGALLLDVSDAGKAQAFLKAQAGAGAHSASFDGVTYLMGTGSEAYGLVGKFAVIGTSAALHGVIETVHGGASLLATSSYRQLSASASGQSLASAYLNPAELLGSHHGSGSEAQGLALLGGILASASPVYVSLTPSPGSIELETLSGAQSEGENRGAAEMFSQLPSNSWLALGIGNLGKRLKGIPQALQGLSSLESSSGLGSLLPKVETKGANLQREFFSWMGPAGVFAGGTSLLNIAAGVVISSTDPTASRAAVAKLGKLLGGSGGSVATLTLPNAEAAVTVHPSGSPLTIDIADGHGKFVIGLGEQSIIQALSPTSTLGGSSTYSTAQSTLGTG